MSTISCVAFIVEVRRDVRQSREFTDESTVCEVQVGDVALDLTVKSFELLWLLASNQSRFSLRQTSMKRSGKEDYVDTNTLNIFIFMLFDRSWLNMLVAEAPTIKTV